MLGQGDLQSSGRTVLIPMKLTELGVGLCLKIGRGESTIIDPKKGQKLLWKYPQYIKKQQIISEINIIAHFAGGRCLIIIMVKKY